MIFGLLFLCTSMIMQTFEVSYIATSALDDKIASFQNKSQQSSFFLINVLPKDICADCSIIGSINIPVDILNKKVQLWPKNSEIVVYCAGSSSRLAEYASQLLKKEGFLQVYVLKGGLQIWSQEQRKTIGACKAGYLTR